MNKKIIYGDTVGTPMSRPDWAEKNERSAAYIKNKPTEDIEKNTEARHTHDNQELLDNLTEDMLGGGTSLPVAYINDDGELILEISGDIKDANINNDGELELKLETENGDKAIVLGKVKGRTPEFRLTEKILEIKYDDENTWSTLVDFSTIASTFDLRLNEETYFLEAQREVDGEWEPMVDLSALKLAHEHSNKDILDKLTDELFTDMDDAIDKKHTHNNINTLNSITNEFVSTLSQIGNEQISNINEIPTIKSDLRTLSSRPIPKQLNEGLIYTDETIKGFSTNKKAIPTADYVWIEGNASDYILVGSGGLIGNLNVVTNSLTESTKATIEIPISNLPNPQKYCNQITSYYPYMRIDFDTMQPELHIYAKPNYPYYVEVTSAIIENNTVKIRFVFLEGKETFLIQGQDYSRRICLIHNYPLNGVASHAEGYETIAPGDYSHVQGKYNEIDMENKYAHIIGNGTSDDNRSNAHTVDWEGNAWFAGSVTTDSVTAKSISIEMPDDTSLTFVLSLNTENTINKADQILGQWLLIPDWYYIVVYDNSTYTFKCIQDTYGCYIGDKLKYGFKVYQDDSGITSLYLKDNEGHNFSLSKKEPYMANLCSYIVELKSRIKALEDQFNALSIAEEVDF